MSMANPRHLLDRLNFRYRTLRWVEISLVSTGAVMMTLALSLLFVPISILSVAGSISAGMVVLIIRFRHYHLGSLNNSRLTTYLNQNYPQLRQSADLLMIDDSSLTGVALLQKRLIIDEFNKLYPEIKVPQQVAQSVAIFLSCLTAYVIFSSFHTPQIPTRNIPVVKQELKGGAIADTLPAKLKNITSSIQPPGYTGLKVVTTGTPDLNVPEGSLVTWQLAFSKEIKKGKIIFSGRDSLPLTPQSNGSYLFKRIVNERGFYQIQWSDRSMTFTTDYYKIELVPDEPPKISVDNLGQFTKLTLKDNLSVPIVSTLGDDYGLRDADIVATVSKGSGESVKFREEKLRFNSPAKISGKHIRANTTLDLKKLGLEPGDEIYFYVEAFDNKTPVANRNRTETFFIALQDTTTEIVATDDGLGVDLMPEYFRSQRQIIIDTEKLLRERKKMSKHDFNSTSNELGYDEKVLRLRYGQFMGEEAESGIAQSVNHPEDEDEEEDPTKKFGHAHDTKNEHNLLEEKKEKQPGHPDSHRDHDGVVKDPNAKEDPLEAFIHNHDDTEEATFFVQSVKAKLKAALSIMWDAELHLRLYDPAKSLPYQYKVLNLLKEISNDSRIYVHRTGFEPAPLKEERRLTADLSEIRNFIDRKAVSDAERYPNIRMALALTEQLIASRDFDMTEPRQQIFRRAGQELAALAIEQPGVHLKGLSLLKILSEKNIPPGEMPLALKAVRLSLWKALPSGSIAPATQSGQPHKLDDAFIKQLESIKNE